MQEKPVINDELKKLIILDEQLKDNFLIALLHGIYKDDEPKEHEQYFLSEYNAYKSYLDEKQDFKASLFKTLQDLLSNDMINDVINDYNDLAKDEATQVIYTLSRLLYLQNKYKDDKIGQKIDEKIKEWLNYIKHYDSKAVNEVIDPVNKRVGTTEYDIALNKMSARLLFMSLPSLNYSISTHNKNKRFMSYWNYDLITMTELHGLINKFISNKLYDSNTYTDLTQKINEFINDLENDINMSNFEIDQEQEIKHLKEKYHIKDVSLENGLNGVNLSEQEIDPFIEELTQLYADYDEKHGLRIQDNEDVKLWRDKADNFIDHLLNNGDSANIDLFTMDYTLEHLAYNEYQKEAYKLNIDKIEPIKEQEKKPRLSAKELKEKYQDITQLHGEVLNPNKKWALVDTSKTNNNILNLREIIGKKVDSNTEITQRKINKLKSKTRPTKQDLNDIKELEELKQEQIEQQQVIISECEDLQADIDLIQSQINATQNGNEVKKLVRRRNKIQKLLNEKRQLLHNEGVYFQVDMEGNLTYEKTNPTTKERYKLMINADYDIQNFNQEGRNFLQYIPNIDNVVKELEGDYITLDIDQYADFNGISNPRRTRQRLLKTLTEMRKESYEYSYIDEKGALQEGSLVLIGDVMTTEYKGKNTIKVQLGGQFKRNIQQAIIKGQIAHVNKDVFKLGHGNNNKKENMAKELYLYFVRLARTEAKKGLIKGVYEKALKVSTILDYLIELNLINYNPNRYNESVKEPLQLALYTGQELGLYDIQTDAFKYYDDIIATGNNGANAQDKVNNFENHLIKISLYNDNTDLDSNEKAHKTYKEHKKKTTKK